MIKTKSLYHLILYSVIFIIILISSFTFIIINNAFDEFQEKIQIIKSSYTIKKKASIRSDVKNIFNFIRYYEAKFKNTKPVDEIQKGVIDALNYMQDTDKNLFIYDNNANAIYPEVVKDKNEFHNQQTNNIITKIIAVAKEDNEGFFEYLWYKKDLERDINKISYAVSYEPWNWTIVKGIYLDEIDKLVSSKTDEYDEKISNYILQILSLTIMLVLYSLFLYKNATILIVNDVREIGNYLKESQDKDTKPIQSKIIFGEFKVIANFAKDAIDNMKIKTSMLENLNMNLESTVKGQHQELLVLVESQKQFLKNSVHEINTPLAIIRTNVDLLKMSNHSNSYIRNIESGVKTIQYIYDDLSYLIKKDRVVYAKHNINFTDILKQRLEFFNEIAIANELFFVTNIQNAICISFNEILLTRIIDNNLSNAIKYSFKDEPIFIKLLSNDISITFEIKTKSDRIEHTYKIFDEFYKENHVRGGLGLGLRIVKEICDKNRVIVSLDSNENETKFIYRFNTNENITS